MRMKGLRGKIIGKRIGKVIGGPVIVVLVSLIMGLVGCAPQAEAPLLPPAERLRVATTTSLYDTGLWGHLEPKFEKEYGVELDIIYAGTGIALEWGRRGGCRYYHYSCQSP